MNFEWDDEKEKSNKLKHDVSFNEAQTVFSNPLANIFDDVTHSDNENREIIVGHSHPNRLLVISFIEKSETIRIISARRATKNERKDYEENAF